MPESPDLDQFFVKFIIDLNNTLRTNLDMKNQTALLIVCLFNSINLNPQFSKSLKPSTHYALYTLRYDDRDYTLKYG